MPILYVLISHSAGYLRYLHNTHLYPGILIPKYASDLQRNTLGPIDS
ncbi:hypothetical protein PROFUN_13926 [Planoprotostelium fungivorum]|uniref:Uncharacterized protein n=1 Tax=Planoprotostelium fungivorum TaxID=1890364 RepID=A0A2P6N2E0_9EUKA|nr:hypothetical protein PROFUN_13926 [Planoprotostelium fungivorum]